MGGDTAVTERTIFHMASIIKPFVATAVMQLVEAGKVDLDAPVTRYIPYFQHERRARVRRSRCGSCSPTWPACRT